MGNEKLLHITSSPDTNELLQKDSPAKKNLLAENLVSVKKDYSSIGGMFIIENNFKDKIYVPLLSN